MTRLEDKLQRQIKQYLQDISFDDARFEPFFSSIIKAYQQYEEKYERATQDFALSSKEQNETNDQLMDLNSSMSAILNNLGLGLLFFGEDGKCSSVYSKSCLDIFKTDPAKAFVWDVLGLEADQKEKFSQLLSFVFCNDSAMGFDDLFKMAPVTITIGARRLALKYRPIYDQYGRLENILLIASDQTEKIQTKEALKKKEEHVGRLIRIVKYRNDFISLMADIESYFLKGDPLPKFQMSNVLAQIKGYIHTLKGLSASFRMENIASILHECEDNISKSGVDLQEAKDYLETQKAKIEQAFKEEISEAETILGQGFLQEKDMCQVPYDTLDKFYNSLQDTSPDLATSFRKTFLEVPLADTLKKLDMYREDTAHRTEKKVYPCIINGGDDVQLSHRRYNPLIQSFIHFIRNSIVHSIEPPEVRLQKGKEEYGRIIIDIHAVEEDGVRFVELLFSDDGAGFNTDMIRAELAQMYYDVENMSENEVLNSTLDEGFTLKKKVSRLSGRGVGLPEIKNQVEEMGGTIKILNADLGSKIMVRFPIQKET